MKRVEIKVLDNKHQAFTAMGYLVGKYFTLAKARDLAGSVGSPSAWSLFVRKTGIGLGVHIKSYAQGKKFAERIAKLNCIPCAAETLGQLDDAVRYIDKEEVEQVGLGCIPPEELDRRVMQKLIEKSYVL